MAIQPKLLKGGHHDSKSIKTSKYDDLGSDRFLKESTNHYKIYFFHTECVRALNKGEFMSCRKCELQKWELKNQQQLLRLVHVSQDLSKQSVLRVANLTSFVLYLIYGSSKFMYAIAKSLIAGPEIVRQISPEQNLKRHEFERRDLKSLPQTWIK